MDAERSLDIIDNVQQFEDRFILFPTLRYSSPFSTAANWQKAVGQVVDGGALDFVAWAGACRSDSDDFARNIEFSLVEGANRIIRQADIDELEGKIGERVGDALLASLEIGQSRVSAAEPPMYHSVFMAITREKDYSTMTEEGAREEVRKSLIVWRQVLSAIDRKAHRDNSGDTVYFAHRELRVDDAKSVITSRVLSHLGYESHTGKNKSAPETHPIEVWRRNLSPADRSPWYSGIFRLLSEPARVRDGEDGVIQSMIVEHPGWYAKPLLNVARDVQRHLGPGKALTIVRELMMGVVSTYHLLDADSVLEDVLIRYSGFDVGNLREGYNREHLAGLLPYLRERLDDMGSWKDIPDTEAFVLTYMGRMLNPNIATEADTFMRLVQFGLFQRERPVSVRLMAFHLLLSGQEALGPRPDDVYKQMIHSVLFAPATHESQQFWWEAMHTSSIEHASDLVVEALMTDRFDGRERGVMVFNLFMSQKYDTLIDALGADGSSEQIAVKKLVAVVETMRESLEGRMGLMHFDSAIAVYRQFKEGQSRT